MNAWIARRTLSLRVRPDSGGEQPTFSGWEEDHRFTVGTAVSVNVDAMARNNEGDALDWGEPWRVAVTVGGERYVLSDVIHFDAEMSRD